MLDRRARELTGPVWDAGGRRLAAMGISPEWVTGIGFVIGIAACVAAAFAWWWTALALWLLNRIIDGLDGPLARMRGETDRGGFLDIMADFAIYGGFVFGVAIALPDARLACAALLGAYYVNGSAFLALSSLLERRRDEVGDERSLRFVGGIAEGSETIIAHSALCVFPAQAALIAWVFAAAVLFTAGQRIVHGMRVLRAH